MGLTTQQLCAVETKGRPLFIQAGAGTGKTFTLTKRIGYGLSEESGPVIDGIENLLTITFTNKAAGELLGRVRAELRERGLNEAALKVDAAWVSTIHSMCRNVLSEHAFEAGIDAGAGLLSEEESSSLLGLAIDGLLVDNASDPRLRLLLDAYGSDGTYRLIEDLVLNKLQLAPQGAASLSLGPAPGEPTVRVLHNALDILLGCIATLQELGAPDTPTCQKAFDKLQQAADELKGFLTQGMHEQLTWTQLDTVLAACPLARGGNLKKQYRPVFLEAYQGLLDAKTQVACAVAYERLGAALELAQDALERHRALKRAAGALDTNDLLIETYRLLQEHPEIAREYQERFDSIMVDEFQDTDLLQVEIVTRMCDAMLSTLATVGDAQQSIYGFRGADLEVYRAMRKRMASCGSQEVALDTNYRSHPHILGFVEDIFSHQEFFGDEFLRVKPGPNNASERPWHADGSPRVRILLSAGTVSAENARKRTSVEELRAVDAQAVAQAFEEYNRAGARYGDMAILMRSTNRAHVYLDALRQRGIPCMVSGGSTFYTLDEVVILANFCRVLENPDDDEALFAALGSHFFDIPDDDLLSLAVVNKQALHIAPEEARVKASLFDALRYLCTCKPATLERLGVAVPSDLTRNAYEVLLQALSACSSTPLSSVLLQAVRASGWYATLQGQGIEGIAVQANIERFADLLDDYQSAHGLGVMGAAEHMRTMCELAAEGTGARGKPGSMVTLGGDVVQIMTIHASKGLEFPIVAVAEFESAARTRPDRALALTEEGASHVALPVNAGKEVADYLDAGEFMPQAFDKAHDSVEYAVYARALSAERAAQEEQRLFYVALTRARDTLLVVAHDSTYASKGELKNGLFKDIAGVLYPDGLPSSGSVTSLPCGELVGMTVTEVPCGEGAGADGQDEAAVPAPAAFERALPEPCERPQVVTRLEKQRDFQSYSSIAHRDDEQAAPGVAALRNREEDAETVSPLGSAFHLVAEWMARVGSWTEEMLEARVGAVARRYELDEAGHARLRAAVDVWKGSDRLAVALAHEQVHAEYPFCVSVQGVPLEGYIDLLCIDPKEGNALVVDYKTGESGDADELQQRYRLQACCYAYAVLTLELARHVELVFVRPEVDMQEISYAFNSTDLESLAVEILNL